MPSKTDTVFNGTFYDELIPYFYMHGVVDLVRRESCVVGCSCAINEGRRSELWREAGASMEFGGGQRHGRDRRPAARLWTTPDSTPNGGQITSNH